MGVLYNLIGRVLREKLKQSLEIVKVPTIAKQIWMEAIKWSQIKNLGDVWRFQTARNTIIYAPSGEKRNEGYEITAKSISDYEGLVAAHLSELIELTQSI